MVPLLASLLGLLATLTFAKPPYCLPGQLCFPSAAEFEAFNCTINGKLIESTPYGSACYKASYDAEACKALAVKKGDFEYRIGLPAGSMYPIWEQNGPLGCPVPDPLPDGTAPSAVISPDCTIGGMAAYVVNATKTEHIAAAVSFAAKHNLRLRIKNTGHDYAGRSNGPGSILIWTRHMNDIDLLKTYQLCASGDAQWVVSVGPGATTGDLYAFNGRHNITTIGAFTATVSAAGGYILGGGIGPLGPYVGMGVDSRSTFSNSCFPFADSSNSDVVQFEAITADGKLKTANACTNPDLFWALRGGGGTFGVVTRTYLKTYPPLRVIDTIAGDITCRDRKDYETVISHLVDLQVPLRNAGYTGVWTAHNGRQSVVMLWIRPFVDAENLAQGKASLAAIESLLRLRSCTPTVNIAQFTGPKCWAEAYTAVIWPIVKAGGPIGTNILNFSRLVSYDIMSDQKKLQKVKEYILGLPGNFTLVWQNSVGAASASVPPGATAVHPEWRKAFALIDIPIFGHWTGVTEPQLSEAQANLQKATTAFNTTAAYYNENSLVEADWRESSWGTNYPRLLQIKKQMDPNGVFSCRRCVGSEGGF